MKEDKDKIKGRGQLNELPYIQLRFFLTVHLHPHQAMNRYRYFRFNADEIIHGVDFMKIPASRQGRVPFPLSILML